MLSPRHNEKYEQVANRDSNSFLMLLAIPKILNATVLPLIVSGMLTISFVVNESPNTLTVSRRQSFTNSPSVNALEHFAIILEIWYDAVRPLSKMVPSSTFTMKSLSQLCW